MNNLGHKLFKGFQDMVSSVKPTLKESKFYTVPHGNGVLLKKNLSITRLCQKINNI